MEEVEPETEEPASFLVGWPGLGEVERQMVGLCGTSGRSRNLEMGKNGTGQGGSADGPETEGDVTSSLMETQGGGDDAGADGKPSRSRNMEANRAAPTAAAGSRAPLQVQKYLGQIEDRRVTLQ